MIKKVFFLLGGLLGLTGVEGGALQAQEKPAEQQLSRQSQQVKGRYRVEKIEKVDSASFYRIYFKPSSSKAASQATILLETHHVHIAVKEGVEMDLTADVVAQDGDELLAQQVLLFIAREHNRVPVWMLSRHNQKLELHGSPYLQMHDPQSDFMIF